MRYEEVRVIRKGGKFRIEFVYPNHNLIARLIHKLSKNSELKYSLLGDKSIVFTPNTDVEFVRAINHLNIDKHILDNRINMYHLSDINSSNNEPNSARLTTHQLIDIAIKKYNVPDIKAHSFTTACMYQRYIQFDGKMSKKSSTIFTK